MNSLRHALLEYNIVSRCSSYRDSFQKELMYSLLSWKSNPIEGKTYFLRSTDLTIKYIRSNEVEHGMLS